MTTEKWIINEQFQYHFLHCSLIFATIVISFTRLRLTSIMSNVLVLAIVLVGIECNILFKRGQGGQNKNSSIFEEEVS